MRVRIGIAFVVATFAAAPAAAEPYWVSWTGDNYPEEEGWTRFFNDANGVPNQGGAFRTLDQGYMALDSLRDNTIVDSYSTLGYPDPEDGEEFVMRWRVRVDDVLGAARYDPVIGIVSEQGAAAGFQLAEDGFRSALESTGRVPLSSGVFHLFEFVSTDMQTYVLSVDGESLMTGQFRPAGGTSRVSWGDGIQGSRSLSTWDFVEFGVIPEPGAARVVLFVAAISAATVKVRKEG